MQPNALRIGVTSLLLGYFILPPAALFANPSGESVTHGQATFTRSGNNLIIHQGSDKLITKWGDFSIAQGEKTQFVQPNSNSAALNRVVGGSRSIIEGELSANGKVILINPAGVTVGPTGVVNVNSFTASTQDLTDQEFIGGGELLYKGTSEATIENHGRITAAGGDAIIIAKHLKNHGEINAANGTVALAAGTEVLVKPVGEERVSIRPGSQKGGTIEQSVAGRVKAAAAEIKAAGNPYALAINLDGLVDTQGAGTVKPRIKVQSEAGDIKIAKTGRLKSRTATGAGGSVEINAAASQPDAADLSNAPGAVNVAGVVDVNGDVGAGGQIDITGGSVTLETDSLVSASGSTAGGQIHLLGEGSLRLDGTVAATGGTEAGGQIQMRGKVIDLGDTTVADASSAEVGGGRITVGGEFQGGIDPAGNAQTVNVAAGAQLKANAGTNGDGGTVIVWSENATSFEGTLSATGGSQSGNGGFAEISGKNTLWITGSADLTAANGELGTVLLDPTELNVVTTAVTANDISWATINGMGANVTLSTYGAGGGTGDINLLDGGIWAGTGTLTFEAFNDINVLLATSLNSSTLSASALTGSFAFLAGNDFNMSGIAGAGRDTGVVIRSSAAAGSTGSITVQTGLVAAGGSFNFAGGSLLTRDGDISIQATNGGNIHISNASQANSQIMAGYALVNGVGTGSLTLDATAGFITIDQVLSSSTAYTRYANAIVDPTQTFLIGGNKRLTIQTGAAGNFATDNRDITIWLRNGSVIQGMGSLVDPTVGITIQSGRDLIVQGTGETYGLPLSESGGWVGHVNSNGSPATAILFNLTSARHFTLGEYDDGNPLTPPALRPVGSIAAFGPGTLNIHVGGDFYAAGGTTPGHTIAGLAANTPSSGSRIVGGQSNFGAVLNFNVDGNFSMTNAAAIAQFAAMTFTVDGNVTLEQSALVGTMGSTQPATTPLYSQDWQIGGNLLMTVNSGLETANTAGGIRVVTGGSITLQDDLSNAPRILASTSSGPAIYLQSLNDSIHLNGGNIMGTYASSVGVGGNISLIANQNVNLNSGGIIRTIADATHPDRQIYVHSQEGSINLNVFTITSGELSLPTTPGFVSGITLQAGDAGVAGVQDVNLQNYSISGNNVTIIGDNLLSTGGGLLETGGDVIQLTAREGDIIFNSTGNVRSLGSPGGTGTSAIIWDAARDIRIQPQIGKLDFNGGRSAINGTAGGGPSTNDATFTFNAGRNILLGGSSGVYEFGGSGASNHSVRDITFNAGDSIFINNRVGGSNQAGNTIQTTENGNLHFIAQNDVIWDATPVVPGGARTNVRTTNGDIVIRTTNGNVNLGHLKTETGDITVAAGVYSPTGTGTQSIRDAYGPRIPNSASNVNIETNSGTVTLTALGSIGVGNGANPISTQQDIKFNLGSDSKITAASNGTGATDGVFLYSFNDLIIGIPASAGISAQGDIVLKSNGNLFVNGDVVTGGVGRTIGLRSNAAGTNASKGRSGDFTVNATLAGDIIISGSILTQNGNIILETGSETINDSFNSIRYNPLVTEAIDAGNANITMRANNDIALGRVVTDGGNVTLTAGFITNWAAYQGGATAVVQNDAGKIYDAFPRELRDSTNPLSAADNANIEVGTGSGSPQVKLIGGLSVGQLPNGQDLDLALADNVQLIVNGSGTNAANGDGVFLSFLGDFSTDSTTSLITSGSNLSLSVTGNLTVASGSALTTANNGNIWLTAYGTFSPTSGNLTVNAGVLAHGTGNINILGIGQVLINSTLQTATGDISIIGAGRGHTYGVDVTGNGVVTTGGGTIHLAALASAEALNATVVTDDVYGRIRVGDVVILGEAETTVDGSGTYFRGVTYGDEVVYNSNGVINGAAGSTATTSQLATLGGATGTVSYTVTNAGIVIIDTTGTAGNPALTSTTSVDVNTVTIDNATTSIYGDANAEADTTTGSTGTQVTTLNGGSTTLTGPGLNFSLTSTGTATVGGSGTTTLSSSGSDFSVGAGDVSGTGVNATIQSATGANSVVTTSSTGTVTNTANYSATGVTTSIAANSANSGNIASGSFTAGGVGVPIGVSLDGGQTTVNSNQAVAIGVQPGGHVALTYATNLDSTANVATGTTGYAIIPVAGAVFDGTTGPSVTLGGSLTTLALAGGAQAQVSTNSLVATGTGSGLNSTGVAYVPGNGVVEIGLTTALTTADVNALAQAGGGSPNAPQMSFNGNTGANVTLAAGVDLTFNATTGFSTTTVVGGVSAIASTAGASVSQNNVQINGTTLGVTAGNAITGTSGGEVQIQLTQSSATIQLGGTTVSAQNTPNVNDPSMWTDLGNGTYQYANSDISIGGAGTVISNGNATVSLAASTAGSPVNANGATLIYNPGTGSFTISAISLTSGSYESTVNLKSSVSIAAATVTSNGGNALVSNLNTSVGYTNLGLNNASLSASSVGASFAGVNLSTTQATVQTSQLVTTTGITSANISGGVSTFANEIRTKVGNTLDMVAGASGMQVSPGGTLVNINGIESYTNTNPLSGSSLRVQSGASITSNGGDIYASGYQNAEISTLNAAGASNAGNGGNLFLEATEGNVVDLAAGNTVNVIGNQATINGGNGLYGNFTTGGVGSVGAGNAIKLDVRSLNFDAGQGGAYFEMAQNRELPVAGRSQGEVAILNDHAIRVTETEKITFGPGTGIDFSTRFWIPELLTPSTLAGIDAGAENVFLRATGANGSIVSDPISAAGARTTGGNVYIDAAQRIGESTADRFLVDGTDVWFRAANGSAFISELNATDIAGTALAAGAEIDVRTETLGNLTVTTEGGPSINHPVDGTNQPTLNGLTANTDVTLDTFQGGVRVHQNITAQTGDVFITANSSIANPGNTTDYGVEIGGGSPVVNAIIQAGGAGNGQSVTIVSNYGDIWRTGIGSVRAQDVHFVTTGAGSVGWRNGSVANTNLLTQAENITFDSVQRVNIRNVPGSNPAGFLWGNVTVAGAAAGDVIFQNDSGQLTVGQLTNTIGTMLTGIVTSGSGAANGYDISIDNVGGGLAGGSSTNVLIAEQISANRQANDPTVGDHALILARTGSILRTGGADAIVTGDRIQLISGTAASNTIGTTASRILTDGNEIIFDSGSNAIITEEDATLLAGRTRNAGNIDVISNFAANNAVLATITVVDLTSTAFGGHTATQYDGVNADTTGDINLEARGNPSDVVFAATARSGSGNIHVAAGRDVVDAIAGDITDGLDSSSSLLNLVTGGNGGDTANVTIQAGRNIGDKGTNTIDVAAGGTITTNSDGAGVGDGTYLSVLGDANIGNNAVITSDRNIDVSTFQRTAVVNGLGAQEGDLTVSTLMSNNNAGYTRLNASDDIFLSVAAGNVAIDRSASGDIVLQARNGGITRTAGLSRLQGQSLHLEAAEDAGVNGLGALQVNIPGNVTFSVEQDLNLSASNQLNVSGQSANGNITLQSGGSMRINDFSIYRAWDLAAADDNINSPANALQFAYVGGDSGIRANQVDGVITLNSGGAIQDASAAEDNSVTAYRAILNAATNIGTNDAMGHVTDLNTEVAFLEANAGLGFANIRERDSVTVGNSDVGTNFRINSGGFIYQEAGSEIHVGNEVELDTTRDTTIGHATLHSTGDLEIGDSEVLGNFTVETTGDTLVTGVLRVAGNLALGIGSVDIDSTGNIVGGSFTNGGTFVVDGTGTVTVYGGTNVSTVGTGVTSTNAPVLTYNAGTLTITATGSSQEFNLSVILDDSGAFLNQYETVNGVTVNSVQVDLRGNTGTQLDNNLPIDDAIVWTGGNNSMDRLIVRTGTVDTTEIGGTLQDYDLGQTGTVDLGGRALNVNSARGANHGAGGPDSSTFGGSTINGGHGSIVELELNNAFGNIVIRDAYTTSVNNAGDLSIDYIHSYGDITASSTTGSVILNAGAPVNANGNHVTYQAAVNVEQQDATALTSGNRVTAITGSGSVGSSTQRLQIDANELEFNSGASVYVEDRFDDLATAGSVVNTADILASAAEAELTVGTVGAQTGITSGNNVILTADHQNIAETIDATNRVTLQANAAGRGIDLGTETAGNLSLTQSELARITATTLQIGNGLAGAIALTSAIDMTGGVTYLRLWNNSTVQTNGTGTIAVENLAVTSNGAIDLFNGNDNSNDGNQATNLAVDSNGNTVDFKNNGALNVANVDGVSGLTATGSDIYLNTSGLISQSAGANVIANGLELDTTRNTSIGHATVSDVTGDLSVGNSRVQGDYTVTTTGNLIVNGQLLVAGDLTLNGMSVILVGTGHIVGGTSNVAGITGAATSNAAYSESGSVGTLTATGAYAIGEDFDLAALLSNITISSGVNTIIINLESTNTSYTLSLAQQAVDLQGANQIANLQVRTGAVDNAVTTQDLDFNLVQTTGAVDLSGKEVTINAAVGANFGGNSALNGGNGSYVELANGANQFGEVHVNEAWNTRIHENGSLDLTQSEIHGNLSAQSMNGDLNLSQVNVTGTSRLVAVGANADVNFTGNVGFGNHAIVAAGEHVQINAGVTVTGQGAMTFIADENAGKAAGDGWFRNLGTIQTFDADERVAIYAVNGPNHLAGYTRGADQVVFGTIVNGLGNDLTAEMKDWKGVGGNTINDKYHTSYQGGGAYHAPNWNDYDAGQGLFGSPVVWYKGLLSAIPELPKPPVIYTLDYDTVLTTQAADEYGNFSDLERHADEYDENFYTQKAFGIYYQRAAFREAAKTWAPDPVNILNGHFNDQQYYIQGKSNMRSYRSDRFHSEYVKYP